MFFVFQGFSESLGLEILKKSDLSIEAPFALTIGEIRNYSKANYGFEIKFGTELIDFNSEKIKAGLCSTFFFNDYGFKREEIQTFYVRGFSEGIWVEYALPKEFLLRSEINLGFAVTKLKAESIYETKIENDYNSFVLCLNSVVSRVLFDIGTVAFYGNGGLNIQFLKEDDCLNTSLGLIAGITIKAGKKWR